MTPTSSVTPICNDLLVSDDVGQNNFGSKLMARLISNDLTTLDPQQHQQQHHQQQPTTPMSAINKSNNNNHHHNHNHRTNHQQQPALDLRTTPTRPMSPAAISASSSPVGRACSAGSSGRSSDISLSLTSARQQHYDPHQQHPKKVKLSEYRKLQQLADEAAREAAAAAGGGHDYLDGRQRSRCNSLSSNNSTNAADSPLRMLNAAAAAVEANGFDDHHHESIRFHDQNRRPPKRYSTLRAQQDPIIEQANSLINNVKHIRQQVTAAAALSSAAAFAGATNGTKKYKGEFDEPTPDEVAQREIDLNRPQHYHYQALERGECACVLGSEFRDKSTKDVLHMIERWRSLNVEQRIKWKWDVDDLPKDIPLSDIKKFEDLRREFSDGRADFGGASKRKPLGIRGTRQFLLILYCLWGHPGRDDPMQRDGYCPHCFAKIKKANEQSTLVRVVNHFNMKHRRGANPRLSPQLDNNNKLPPPLNNNNNNSVASDQSSTAATTDHDQSNRGINNINTILTRSSAASATVSVPTTTNELDTSETSQKDLNETRTNGANNTEQGTTTPPKSTASATTTPDDSNNIQSSTTSTTTPESNGDNAQGQQNDENCKSSSIDGEHRQSVTASTTTEPKKQAGEDEEKSTSTTTH